MGTKDIHNVQASIKPERYTDKDMSLKWKQIYNKMNELEWDWYLRNVVAVGHDNVEVKGVVGVLLMLEILPKIRG